ncbi:RNA polymerase II mediator complex subunit Sin4 [Xylariaceae sp. FL1272]|nr:RNA polymerase II mediator complex subunit Sin4 [Xylariaceae sp. FL1272]
MADNAIPLLLDDAMPGIEQANMHVDLDDVDDLFGDAVPLTLPSQEPSGRLRFRLDEMRGRGCCQGLAWSKGGSIASIAPDGRSLELRHLRADPKDGQWGLSEPKSIQLWENNFAGGPIVHLSWGPAPQSHELAVMDAVGRVCMLSFNTDINRPTILRRWDGDAVDDLHAVVGTYWLNPLVSNARFYPHYTPHKSGNGSNYVFEQSGTPIMGPSHPSVGKSAFICITTNGLLKMFWTQTNHKLEETKLELESTTSADDLITHAAACADKTKCIYIAMATASIQLRVVQVSIAFKSENPQNAPQTAQTNQPLSPNLGKKHVAVTSWFQTGMVESAFDASMTKVSHIEMLPNHFNIQTKELSPIVILTVRSFIPGSNSPYGHEVQSIIDRWELLTEQKQTVHPAFERLAAKRGKTGNTPPSASRLKKLPSTVVNKIVMGVKVMPSARILAFYYNDGTIEYRDRFTMTEMYREINLERIDSILQAGFSQTGEPSCLQMAFSPAGYSLVQMYEDGQIKWHNLAYTLGDPLTISDANLAAVVASCAASTAVATGNNSNIDDIFAVTRKFNYKDQLAMKWVTDLVQIIRFSLDYSEDSPPLEQLMRNQHFQLCLTIFNHLGWNGEFHSQHYRRRIASLVLSIRNIIILISLSNSPQPGRASSSPLDEPEVVDALAGCAKWSMDFLGWLFNHLLALVDDRKFMGFLQSNQPQQLVPMTQYLLAKNEIALHLILCSSTRLLISSLCRRIGLLESWASRAIAWYMGRTEITDTNSPRHALLRAAYQKAHGYISSALISPEEVEKLLATLSTDVRLAYSTALPQLAEKAARNQSSQNANAPKPDFVKEARQHCELNLFLVQPPHSTLFGAIAKLFRSHLPELQPRVDTATLQFQNYHILEITNGPEAIASRRRRGTRIDMFKRVPISRKDGAAWRQCTRCGTVMEDLAHFSSKPGLAFLAAQQRPCCCGGRFAILPNTMLS